MTTKTTLPAILWGGPDTDKGRKVRAQRECPCGCDFRDGTGPMAEGHAVGYITGSDETGRGFTIYAPDEETYATFAAVFGEAD